MTKIEYQLKEFCAASLALKWQRLGTIAGASVIAAYYVSLEITLICFAICLVTECFDHSVTNRILKWDGKDREKARHFLKLLTISSALASISVVQYIILVAIAEGPSIHLGPLFFLFAAALYAAMNNYQLPRVLMIRMAIYSAVFLFIPTYDLWVARPPLASELWKQLGIVMFVLYFVVECSRKFVAQYQIGLRRLHELRVERDRVVHAYDLQSQFVSIVSHELRTPLTSVKGSLDLLSSQKVGALSDQSKYVVGIGRKNANRLATLIDELLDFQKLKSGKMDFHKTQFDLDQLMRDAVEDNRPAADLIDVSIRTFPAHEPLIVNGDFDRLMQAMTNILSNAMKFSNPGGIVSVSLERRGARARISVRDDGVGIPDNARHLVYKPFSQVDSTDKRAFGGTGLGMSITKQIMEAHDGAIDFISTPGVGTTFFLDLDIVEEADEMLPVEQGSDAEPRLYVAAGT